jgi:16S rRNA (cytidine1402-2'-O)-methyltransferase
MADIAPGTLLIVATPIGNLDDVSARALAALRAADAIAAEDTRQSERLLRHYGIARPLLALHEHNEREIVARLIERLRRGERIALICDAGTPLISDPGFRLVAAAHEAGLRVSPIPGPCAAIAALSAAGLATDRFVFEGFLPAKSAARRARLAQLGGETRTLVLYESRHRLLETLADLVLEFGLERRATLARELTKLHEQVVRAPLGELAARVEADPEMQLGECVLIVEGAPESTSADASLREGQRVFALLARELAPGRAAKLAAAITGAARNALYRVEHDTDEVP